jgi:eukaryotic-like serine/threonine-protein kinase
VASPIPTKIGKYDILGVIGRGGMGVVYKATDPHLDRLVAIKMIIGAFAEHPDMLARFFREAHSLGSLQHPNIVTVFDLGDYDGNPYLVMEYLEGECLDAIMTNQRPLSLIDKLAVVIHVCHGLSYAHARGVIHRDIKPANIMLNKEGGVKIFDFGIAYAGKANLTRTGKVMGTLRYMAPEQFLDGGGSLPAA